MSGYSEALLAGAAEERRQLEADNDRLAQRVSELEAENERLALACIEATNPGIDMGDVGARRRGTRG